MTGASFLQLMVLGAEAGQWRRVWLLEDYNTRVVVLGTMLLGMAAGIAGSFTLLRRRALMGDALSHATLPGLGLAFLTMVSLGGSGKWLPGLLVGAALTGALGMLAILLIRGYTRIKEDAALGIVLSVFFGAGVAILGIVQQVQGGYAAGLEAFIYGKTASMVAADARWIGAVSLVCVVAAALLFKELKLLCFDEPFAAASGYPVVWLDLVMTGLVILVTIIGLQAVGLVLMIALLVIPAAAARFWTGEMSRMTICAAALGAASGAVGSTTSAIFPQLPSGATIVMVAAGFFTISLIAGTERGLGLRLWRRRELHARIDRQHLLRAVYELAESRQTTTGDQARPAAVPWEEVLARRSWSQRRLATQVRAACRRGEVVQEASGAIKLTAAGQREAARLVHEHRLWELYLITHADVAPGKVDRGADTIEHVLDAEMIDELERLLQARSTAQVVQSPHPIDPSNPLGTPGS